VVEEGSPSTSASDLRACPFCAEQIQQAAAKCRYCKNDVGQDASASTSAEGTGARKRLPLVIGIVSLLTLLAIGGFLLLRSGTETSTTTLDGNARDVLPEEVVEDIFVKQVRENVPSMRNLSREDLVSFAQDTVCEAVGRLGGTLTAEAIYNNSDASRVDATNFVTISVVAFCPEFESEL
jgi:hypothetical protein